MKNIVYIDVKRRLIALIMGFLAINANAADYYCNPNTGDKNNAGTKENPWGKLEDVFERGITFSPGDKIFLLEGKHGDVVVSGTNTKYVKIIGLDNSQLNSIVFGNDSAPAVKWSLENVIIENNSTAVFVHSNSSKIKINSLNIKSSIDFNETDKSELLNNKSVGIQISGNNCKVENNNISDKHTSVRVSGINNKIGNNYIQLFSKFGIDLQNGNNSVENNLISESVQLYEQSNIAINISGGGKLSSIVIRANQIINFRRNNRKYIGQLNGISSESGIENSIIENNLIVSNSINGINISSVANTKIVNNTLVNPYFGFSMTDNKNVNTSIVVGRKDGEKSENVVVRNNIAGDFVLENASGVADYNLVLETDVKEYDKNFNSWAKFDFSLISSSPALNSGTFEGAPKYDANNVPRSIGNFINIGAFEYGKIDESNSEIVVVVNEHDRELRSKGKDDWDGQAQIRIGGSGEDFDGVAVFPFQLPLLPGGKKIVESDFSAYMIKIDNRPKGNIDVYGLPFKNNFWVGHDMFYQGTYGQDLTARPIQSAYADGTSISGTTRLSETGKEGIKAYLNTSYEVGAKPGDYVFIRLNPSSEDVEKYNRWIFQSGNAEKDKNKAKLYLTVGYPELNKPGSEFKEIENTLVATSNILNKGKINFHLFGFDADVNVKVFDYEGNIVFENNFDTKDSFSKHYENVNERALETSKYIVEYTSKGVSKKQAILVW